MNLQLVRYCYGPDHVAGLLKFGDNLELSLWTLECPWRDNQIFVSCVPDGSYPLVAFDSPDHPDCWVLTPVPGRTGILSTLETKLQTHKAVFSLDRDKSREQYGTRKTL